MSNFKFNDFLTEYQIEKVVNFCEKHEISYTIKTKERPENHGKKWNQGDRDQVIEMMKEIQDIDLVAQNFGRTRRSVVSILSDYVVEDYFKNKNHDRVELKKVPNIWNVINHKISVTTKRDMFLTLLVSLLFIWRIYNIK